MSYYQFNNMLGRLASSNRLQAFRSFVPKGSTESSSALVYALPKSEAQQRPMATLREPMVADQSRVSTWTKPGEVFGRVPDTKFYRELQARQALYMQYDGKKIWQKGPYDYPLYYLMCFLGVSVFTITSFLHFSWYMPKPKQEDE